MFKWKNLGRVFNPTEVTGREWLKEFAQAPATLVFENFVRVYFSCRPYPDENGQYVNYSSFVDLNRLNLFEIINIGKKPILDLGGLGDFDEFGTYPVSVIRNENDIFAYYGGWTRCESVPFNVAIGMAKSIDNGVSFKKIGNGPVLSYTVDEPFVLSEPKIRKFDGIFYLWYVAGRKWKIVNGQPKPVYKIRCASSIDGVSWKKINRDLIQSKLEEDEVQASPDVFFSNGKYHMFFCYKYSADYIGKDNGYRIGYAFSEDLENWERDDSKAGIDVSEDGWDSEMISYPHIFELDGKTYMFYLGNSIGQDGFGLAELVGNLD